MEISLVRIGIKSWMNFKVLSNNNKRSELDYDRIFLSYENSIIISLSISFEILLNLNE